MYYFVCIYFMKFHHFLICLYLSFLSCLYLILLFEPTGYMNLYLPFKRLGLVLLASPFSLQSAVADLLLTLDLSPPLHAIVLLHLLHVALFESFCAKYSHTFDRLPFGLFSVKLMASSVCACSVKCCLLFTVIRLLL